MFSQIKNLFARKQSVEEIVKQEVEKHLASMNARIDERAAIKLREFVDMKFNDLLARDFDDRFTPAFNARFGAAFNEHQERSFETLDEIIEGKTEDLLETRSFEKAVEGIIDNYIDVPDAVSKEINTAMGDFLDDNAYMTKPSVETLLQEKAHDGYIVDASELSSLKQEIETRLDKIEAMPSKIIDAVASVRELAEALTLDSKLDNGVQAIKENVASLNQKALDLKNEIETSKRAMTTMILSVAERVDGVEYQNKTSIEAVAEFLRRRGYSVSKDEVAGNGDNLAPEGSFDVFAESDGTAI